MHRSILLAALLPLAAACGADLGAEPGAGAPDGVVFLAQAEPHNAADALFQGGVILDDAGCIRLATAGRPTVIWPLGSTIERRDGQLHVSDGAGRHLATIGEQSSFGGGHFQTHAAAHLTARDHERAETQCPGAYWLAAPRWP